MKELMPNQTDKVDGDSALWIKNLWWMVQAQRKRPGVRLLLEQPNDPQDWLQSTADGQPAPSFLAWKEAEVVRRMLGLELVEVDQGALGHATRKPTALLTNMKAVQKVKGLPVSGRGYTMAERGGRRGSNGQRQMAAWAPAVQAMTQDGVKVKTLTAKEKGEIKDWQEHYKGGHCPFRRDCAVCLETMGRDRQRRVVATPDSFCMSLDLAGTFKPGEDQDVYDAKYMLVGVITVPVKEDAPLVESLRGNEADPRGWGR